MRGKKRAAALILSAFAALGCAGCADPAAGLYALPQVPERYARLETLVSERIAEGCSYAPPEGGGRRESVQLHDLDGDGADEAVAFLAGADGIPAVYVYRLDEAGDYYLDAIIAGEGEAVDSADYADLDGDGADELLLVWRTESGGLLSAYRLTARDHASVVSAVCGAYYLHDLDGDGRPELLVLDGEGSLGRYSFAPEGAVSVDTADLSRGAGDVVQALAGGLSDGRTALFVDSRWGADERITDVFAVADGQLRNITAASGQSNTLRREEAFSADINGDGVVDLPEASGDALNWYSLDSTGRRSLAATTYHDYEDGWYLTLGPALTADLSVSVQEDTGCRAVTFEAAGADGARQPVLTIGAFTGEDRLDRAGGEGWTVLARSRTTVYAARLTAQELVSGQELEESFHLIVRPIKT